jgi:hypothetical protein
MQTFDALPIETLMKIAFGVLCNSFGALLGYRRLTS